MIDTTRRPDLVVYARALTKSGGYRDDGKHWKKIGVAWSNATSKGVPYTRVVLDFMPNDNVLTLWPADEKFSGEEEP